MTNYRTVNKKSNNRRNRGKGADTNCDRYRLQMTFPNGSSRNYHLSDRPQAERLARENATCGATVDLQERDGWEYHTIHTYQPQKPR